VIFSDEEEEEFQKRFSDDDDDVKFVGSKNKFEKFGSDDWEGTVLDGIEGFDTSSDFKQFKVYDPTTKPRAKYWQSKKETFVCQTGAKHNFNAHITDELEKLLKVYTNEKDIGRM
jgi:DNA polymerase lambda